MTRFLDWRSRLQTIVDAYAGLPFQWGETDCAHFARDCALAISGKDFLQFGFYRTYSSRLTSRIRLWRHGFKSTEAGALEWFRKLNCPEIAPKFAREGDVGLTADGTFAVRFAPGFVARDPNGKFRVVTVARCWRI